MNQVYKQTLFFMVAFFLVACSDDNGQTPYMMGNKPSDQKQVYTVSDSNKNSAVAIATIEAETQKEIVKINKERDLELQKMEQNTKLIGLKTQNEMAIKEHNLSAFVKESEIAFKNSTLLLVALSMLSLFALIFYIFRKRREDRLKMHENELQSEMYIREKELQLKMAEKILDTIASGKLSKEREQYLLDTLDRTTPGLPR
ncbi:MAG: hypothetical protein PF439_03670 [Helicobacteraceae bacterium]|jgi:hypothetical protein|nr:hypothetical protein [Helicobacteraceae bacterium]